MTDTATTSNLRPAVREDVADALSHALLFNGRKRNRQPDQAAARITADHLLRCLEQSGFVMMRKPPTQQHSGGDLGLYSGGLKQTE